MIGIFAALALIAVARHPSADIQILTHDSTDRTPHRVKAAIDLGLVGVSVLITWTGEHLR
ncbi:hypothetical protein AB5I39_13025 [Sphingomonas sp. MMS24-J45]|uniref:hypothetical protein n=1 Tax=Sphingomonas sp. MMS24-J45 TaxID=3238806 RepID=UPI00384E765E